MPRRSTEPPVAGAFAASLAPRQRRGAAVAAVLVLHLGVAALLAAALLPRTAREPAPPRWLTVSLPAVRDAAPSPATRAPTPDETPPPPTRPAAARARPITPPAAALRVPQAAPSDPAAAAAADVAPAQAPPPRSTRAADSPPPPAPPLDLTLPPRAVREPVGTAPSMARQAVEAQVGAIGWRSAEARMAHRLEADWTVENLGDGRIRMRRGDQCVMLKETQASQLDPWNLRGPPPRGAGPCP